MKIVVTQVQGCKMNSFCHSDPELRYANGITDPENIDVDVDELHIMLFHKLALELGVDEVETFGCRVNKKGGYHILNFDSYVLIFF